MINTCYQCGENCADKKIEVNNNISTAICPKCGYKHRFLQLPLFIIGGASGTGKSTVCKHLFGNMDNVVILETDIIWQEEFNKPENNYRQFFETWLRLAKNICQSGKPVVLFGAGFGVPDNIEPCIERRYFSKIYYLNIYCSDNEIEKRLKERPQWRNCHNKEFIDNQKEFNNWVKNYGKDKKPKIDLFDTTDKSIDETVEYVRNWINNIEGI